MLQSWMARCTGALLVLALTACGGGGGGSGEATPDGDGPRPPLPTVARHPIVRDAGRVRLVRHPDLP